MSISFQITKADIQAAARFACKHQSPIQNEIACTQLIGAVLAALVVFSIAFWGAGQIRFVDFLFALVWSIVIYFGLGLLFNHSFIERYVKQATDGNPDYVRNMAISLEDDGIAGNSEIGKTFLAVLLHLEAFLLSRLFDSLT